MSTSLVRPKQPIKLALLSCGLGSVQRGFEISTSRWFRAVSSQPDFDVKLFSGGHYPEAIKIWTVSRERLLKLVAPLPMLGSRRAWETSYVLEQITFSLGLLPRVLNKWQPDVIWTKEVPLAHFLHAARHALGLRYKVIFANGAPFMPKTYAKFDFIQQLQPESYVQARQFGVPAEKMEIIPNCAPAAAPELPSPLLRAKYGYRENDWVVVCVAAWNRHHKRIDYVIEEVARIADPGVKLLLCGHSEPDAAYLQALAEAKLGSRVKWVTLPPQEVIEVLHLSDVFVLASLREGLGMAIIEAAMAGVAVISHPHAGSKYILQDDFWLADLSQGGNLAKRLQELKASPPCKEKVDVLRQQAIKRFSEQSLALKFLQTVKKVIGLNEGHDAGAATPASGGALPSKRTGLG